MPEAQRNAPGKRYGSPKPFRSKPKPEGYVFGRPTLYKPEYCQQAIDYMAKGYSVTALAGKFRVSKQCVYEWMLANRDFGDAINIGRAARVGALEHKLLNTHIGVGVTAAIFALKNADPDEWQDRYNTVSEVNVTVRAMTDEQLLDIAARAAQSRTIEHDPSLMLQHSNERERVADDAQESEKPTKQGV